MSAAARAELGAIGDTILIASPGHSSPDRRGEIVAVVDDTRCACCLVRWPNGTTSLITAGTGTLVPALRATARADLEHPRRRRSPDWRAEPTPKVHAR